ncbi:39S ribosomal protein L3, mitochondrial [Diorhabda carinulata]|uniref:39S ribosomal protein L3, mitochondrial n=1 Tax=Diorhabda carinulata TaxID=1163345 RepID=UPI0025A0F5FF|nr:39S ribosomal protein L3, mitochondrial [Diorhabda carinulata]
MAFALSTVLQKCNIRIIEERLFTLSITCSTSQKRSMAKLNPKPRLRNPTWFTQKTINKRDEEVTQDNEQFVQEVIKDKYSDVPKKGEISTDVEWTPDLQRTGVIARKIGVYPLWMKNGKQVLTTLLQILDNHVIKQYSPYEYDPPRKSIVGIRNKKACLLLGAEGADPSNLTKEYCGLFKDSGVIPKQILARFFVSPDAVLPLGTLISAKHFQVGNALDVRAKTMDRGFQGVMKRHGFKGMPASHGVTKTHRRGGNIGGGGEKGRVWPGTKMPGHMGNRWRVTKGVEILRINTKYNVIWVKGQAIPGETNCVCYVYDSKLPLRKPKNPLPFPTYLGGVDENEPEDIYHESIHPFSEPTIVFNENK